MNALGNTYRDKVTGFIGVATGHVVYLTGCSQLLLNPPCDVNGNIRKSHWFDEQRCELLANTERIIVDNSEFQGCDREAPKRT